MPKIFGKESQYLKRKDLRAFFLAVLAIVFGGFVYYLVFIRHLSVFFSSGIFGVLGFFVAIAVIKYFLKESRKYQKISDQFYRGSEGEDIVGDELDELPENYYVFRDAQISSDSGNIDFVVLGPTGIFVVEVKSHRGRIGFDGEELTLNGNVFYEKNILGQAKAEAFSLHNYLKQRLGKDFFVVPVICFSSDYASLKFGLRPVNNVYVIQRRFLINLLTSGQKRLADADILKIEKELRFLVSGD